MIKDMFDNRKYNYINNDIVIDFKLSKTMNELVSKAENADSIADYGLYMNLVYATDARAKLEVSRHLMNEREWSTLLRKYKLE